MVCFFLSTDLDNRIILDEVPHGNPIQELDADPEYEGCEIYRSAWQVARDRVDEFKYRHEYGHGYFFKEPPEPTDNK